MSKTADKGIRPVMICNCRATGIIQIGGNNVMGCVTHGETQPMDPQPELDKRVARCYCGSERDSTEQLAFFRFRPEKETDEFYCGHAGWD